MKFRLLALLVALLPIGRAAELTQEQVNRILAQAETSREHRLEWFKAARFGLFLHWGVYSVPARAEWVFFRERIPPDEYAGYAGQFKAENYNPDEWMKMAVAAGMKYAVLTARHHDGYCLWNTKTTKWSAMYTGPKRDLVKEYVEACRRNGLRVGLYYSIKDWHHPDYIRGEEYKDDEAMKRFGAYMRAQIKELLTQYGKIDILWFDGPSKTPERWGAAETLAMAFQINPDLIVNDRIDRSHYPEPTRLADFETFEQELRPPRNKLYWESCMTLADRWGYTRFDNNYKSLKTIVEMLQHCVRYRGNLLLNIGPKADGRFPSEAIARMKELGSWMNVNREAVFGVNRSPIGPSLYGESSVRDNLLYLLIYYWPGEKLYLGDLKNRIVSAEILGRPRPLTVAHEKIRRIVSGLPPDPPDPSCTVIKLTLDGPAQLNSYVYDNWPYDFASGNVVAVP